MSSQYIKYPKAVPVYPNAAAFPTSAPDGDLAIALDNHDMYEYQTGVGWVAIAGPGVGGSVSSVALAAPVEFVVSGSPITTAGTLTLTKAVEPANTVYAGPTSGGSAQPTFRALVAADIPSTLSISALTITTSLTLSYATASTVLVTDGSKNVVSSSVLSSELTYLANNEALTTFTMADNQSSAANVATWTVASFSNIVMDYSINRGSGNRENGSIRLCSDGSTAGIAQQLASIGTSGVTFTVDISAGSIRLRYTSTNTGTAPVMKYKLQKWLA